MNSIKYLRNGGHLVMLMLLPVALSAQGIQVTNGGHLVLTGAVKVVLHNAGITNNGNVAPGNATVFFTGSQNARIAGNNSLPFTDVIMSKQSGSFVVLEQDISISGTITMNTGNMLLNGHTLDLITTGTIAGEKNGAQITGFNGGSVLLTRRVTTAPTAFNPGNIGLEITSPVAPGIVVIERRHVPEQVTNGIQGIQRSFIISSQVNTGMNATVRFFYLDSELNGHDESSLLLWKGSDVANSWIPVKSTGDIHANSLSIAGLDHWDRFTAANPDQVSMRINKEFEKNGNLEQPTVRVYPNPSRDVFTMELFSPREKDVVVVLYDQYGRVLKKKPAHFIAGMNRVQWDLNRYAAGVYYIIFKNHDIKTMKITKE